MVLQSAVDKLKEKPKDERVAVASGVAITVVVVLLAAWAILFFKRIQSGEQQVNLGGGAQDQFNFQSVKQAQQQLQTQYNSQTQDQQDLQAVRDAAASQQTTSAPSPAQQTPATPDQFGVPNSTTY